MKESYHKHQSNHIKLYVYKKTLENSMLILVTELNFAVKIRKNNIQKDAHLAALNSTHTSMTNNSKNRSCNSIGINIILKR
jgi:hypothetical protein